MPHEVATLPRPHEVGKPARDSFADEQRQLIRRTIAPDANEAEFDLFLDISARYGLNPLHGEIWLARMPGRDGGQAKFTVIVGRDGFLSIANRQPDFGGVEADVVRALDHFRRMEDGTIQHTYELGIGADGEEAKRGPIVGAWARVHRHGRVPTYFFAPWHEYAPTGKNRAWSKHPSSMILKCAQANALRHAFSLSGLYSEAEMTSVLDAAEAPEVEGEPEWGDNPVLAARLQQLVGVANEVKPGAFRPAKVRHALANATDEERQAFIMELVKTITDAGGTVPGPPEASTDPEAQADESIPDAEVVED